MLSCGAVGTGVLLHDARERARVHEREAIAELLAAARVGGSALGGNRLTEAA